MADPELVGEALLRAEAIAGDYHPARSSSASIDHARTLRAASVLRRGTLTDSPEDYGSIACARLLEELARVLQRREHLPVDLTTTATTIVNHLLGLGSARRELSTLGDSAVRRRQPRAGGDIEEQIVTGTNRDGDDTVLTQLDQPDVLDDDR